MCAMYLKLYYFHYYIYPNREEHPQATTNSNLFPHCSHCLIRRVPCICGILHFVDHILGQHLIQLHADPEEMNATYHHLGECFDELARLMQKSIKIKYLGICFSSTFSTILLVFYSSPTCLPNDEATKRECN